MEPIYSQQITVSQAGVDRFGRMKPSRILYEAQQMALRHCNRMAVSTVGKEQQALFWAVIRHRVQITRLPMENETVTLETWPLPTTRTAYPRSTVAYDAQGRELFRSISLWVLMDRNTRALVLPGKSGVAVPGLLRGMELALPGNLLPQPLANLTARTVGFTELDGNGHMNNSRFLDWLCDLLPSDFHRAHPLREFTVCYLSEALEGEQVQLRWALSDGPLLRAEGRRTPGPEGKERVFSAEIYFG